MQIIGVTGTIGAGKSTICDFLKNNIGKLAVFDCDAQCHKLLNSKDRKAIAEEIFSNEDKRKKFEIKIWNEIFNLVDEEIKILRNQNINYFVIDAPLLFQSGLDKKCDKVIFVDAPQLIRRTRYILRTKSSAEDFDKRDQIISSYFQVNTQVISRIDLSVDTSKDGYFETIRNFFGLL